MMAAAPVTSVRPLRRDAELNLARILTAAQEVFAEFGFDASMEQVAGRAGVGVGTLYRRFPNKESLVAAIAAEVGERSRALARSVLDEVDAGEGIFEFMRECVAMPSSVRALVSHSSQLALAHLDLVAPLVDRLIAGAKGAGTLRSEVTFSDIVVALLSVRSVEDRCGSHQGARHLQLLLDGLRPAPAALPHRPLSRSQLGALLVTS
jgi:AcrR family transcriptional regulator